jgi:hypothetical protein
MTLLLYLTLALSESQKRKNEIDPRDACLELLTGF